MTLMRAYGSHHVLLGWFFVSVPKGVPKGTSSVQVRCIFLEHFLKVNLYEVYMKLYESM